MANIKSKDFIGLLKKHLPSDKQQSFMVKKIAKSVGVTEYSPNLTKEAAVRKLKELQKSGGVLKSSSRHITAERFGTQLRDAAAPKKPEAKVVHKPDFVGMRERMDEEAKKNANITAALSRDKSSAPAKGSTSSASRPQAPLAGGVIGQAAHKAGSTRGASRGMFGGEQQIERSAPPTKAEEKSTADEAVDMFGED